MLGRVAYNNPWLLVDGGQTRADVGRALCEGAKWIGPLRHVTRHMVGLFHRYGNTRLSRHTLSDPARLSGPAAPSCFSKPCSSSRRRATPHSPQPERAR